MSTQHMPFKCGEWIMCRSRKNFNETDGYPRRARLEDQHRFMRHCSPEEIAQGEAREAEAQRAVVELDAFRATREYRIVSRLLSMEEKGLVETLGPKLLSQIAAKLGLENQA